MFEVGATESDPETSGKGRAAGACKGCSAVAMRIIVLGGPRPKMASCLKLATKTLPLSTTGTMLAFPVKYGQLPAMPENSFGNWLSVALALNAYRVTVTSGTITRQTLSSVPRKYI